MDTLFEQSYWSAGERLIACDEAGYGSCSGSLFICALAFPVGFSIPECLLKVRDSKKTEAAERQLLATEIQKHTDLCIVVEVTPLQINNGNIYWQRYTEMRKALEERGLSSSHTVFDGDRPLYPDMPKHKCLVKGDSICFSIAAASIVAKHAKDLESQKFHTQWPEYGFADHSGYLTAAHKNAIIKHGALPIHRDKFIKSCK